MSKYIQIYPILSTKCIQNTAARPRAACPDPARSARGRAGLPPPGILYISCTYLDIFWTFFSVFVWCGYATGSYMAQGHLQVRMSDHPRVISATSSLSKLLWVMRKAASQQFIIAFYSKVYQCYVFLIGVWLNNVFFELKWIKYKYIQLHLIANDLSYLIMSNFN